MNSHSAYHKTPEAIQHELTIIEQSKRQPSAFAPLYDSYFKAILQFVYQRLETKEQAIDITQNTFVKALQNISRFQYKGVPFSAWLYRIALNEVNDFYRKTAINRVVNLDEYAAHRLVEEEGDSQDDDVVQQRKSMLQAAIRQITPEEFIFIEMRFFDQLSFAEIGDIMGITENNAKVKTYRILEKMKKYLQIN
jgi:RNA polymerase sigma-70 factor, ECF subfamily